MYTKDQNSNVEFFCRGVHTHPTILSYLGETLFFVPTLNLQQPVLTSSTVPFHGTMSPRKNIHKPVGQFVFLLGLIPFN